MTKDEIDLLLRKGKFAESCERPELVETHISWVVLCDEFVFKIKKPIRYSFLDFSTVEKRKYYSEREVELNKRFTNDIYLDVKPVCKIPGDIVIGVSEGVIIDHAVRMRKLDRSKQMDMLLSNNKVTSADIKSLANKIANFHQQADIIYEKDFLDVREKFNDLLGEKNYLQETLGVENANLIARAVEISNTFLATNKNLLASRMNDGLFRDCHGDLHSRNIFLLPSPQPFDCIEFNDDYRQIDVLNEIAFLCMDLDAFGRHDLSNLFLDHYTRSFAAIRSGDDQKLFIYYKAYRANIRAKVNSLRARDATNDVERKSVLAQVDKYMRLMDGYLQALSQ